MVWAAAVGVPAGPRPASEPATAVAEATADAANAAMSFGDLTDLREDVLIRDKMSLRLAHSSALASTRGRVPAHQSGRVGRQRRADVAQGQGAGRLEAAITHAGCLLRPPCRKPGLYLTKTGNYGPMK